MSGDPVLALLVEIDAKLNAYFERAAERQATLQADLAARMDQVESRLMAMRGDSGLRMDGISAVLGRETAMQWKIDATSSTLQALARQVQRLRNEVEELKKRPT